MHVLNLVVKGKGGTYEFVFPVKRMVNAGYVGRDQEAVKRHIEELKVNGIPAPEEVPTLYPVASYLVGVGSDHTDRKLEADSIIKAKQMCPNVMSTTVWPYEEVKSVWDNLEMRSWVVKDGNRILYQETRLEAILTVEDLVSFVKQKVTDGDLESMVIFSGTVAAIGGEMIAGEGFEVELRNPETGESLRCDYQVKIVDYVK